MHNLTVANGYNRNRNAINVTALETTISNVTYRYWIPAFSLLQIGSKASYVAPDATVPGHWLVPDGDDDTFSFYLGRNAEWRVGTVYPVLHWSTSAADDDVVFSAAIQPSEENIAFVATTPREFVVTAGAVADALTKTDLLSVDLHSDAVIGRQHAGLHLVIGVTSSSGDDTNTGDKAIYGVELVYRERSRQAGAKN